MGKLLKDKCVIVTGSSSGIGYSIAKAVIDAGGKVMLHGTRDEILIKAAETLGENAFWVSANLTNENAPEIISNAALKAFGRIDGLVNNAGIFPRSSIETVDNEHFDWLFHINTRAPLMLTQEMVKDCRKREAKGSVVNIGSINAWCGGEDLLVYSMTKGAIMTMTRNLGDTLSEEGIRVNQLNVGWTLTEGEINMQKSLGQPDDWHVNLSKAAAPRGELLNPIEIANHVVFWLSDLSAPVTGSVYEIEQYPVIGRNKIAG